MSFERHADKLVAANTQALTEALHLRRAAADAGEHVVALDRAPEEELTRSSESLGRHLT